MMEPNIRRIITKLTILVCCLMLFCQNHVYADDTGSIEIRLKKLDDKDSDRSNVEVQLYQVGTVDENTKPEFYSDLDLGAYPQTGEELEAAAKAAVEKLKDSGCTARKTDSNGIAMFSGLNQGVYLVVFSEQNVYGSITPFLVQIPYYEKVNGQLEGPVYQVSVEPKAEWNSDEIPSYYALGENTPTPTPVISPTKVPEPVITNTIVPEKSAVSTVSPTITQAVESGSSGSIDAVKTGDETPVEIYIGLAALAMAFLAAVRRIRSNRRRDS